MWWLTGIGLCYNQNTIIKTRSKGANKLDESRKTQKQSKESNDSFWVSSNPIISYFRYHLTSTMKFRGTIKADLSDKTLNLNIWKTVTKSIKICLWNTFRFQSFCFKFSSARNSFLFNPAIQFLTKKWPPPLNSLRNISHTWLPGGPPSFH